MGTIGRCLQLLLLCFSVAFEAFQLIGRLLGKVLDKVVLLASTLIFLGIFLAIFGRKI